MSCRSQTWFASAGRCREAICAAARACECRTLSGFLALPVVGFVCLCGGACDPLVAGRFPCGSLQGPGEAAVCGVNWAPGVRKGRGQDQALISCPQSQRRGSLVYGTRGASRPLPVSSRSVRTVPVALRPRCCLSALRAPPGAGLALASVCGPFHNFLLSPESGSIRSISTYLPGPCEACGCVMTAQGVCRAERGGTDDCTAG